MPHFIMGRIETGLLRLVTRLQKYAKYGISVITQKLVTDRFFHRQCSLTYQYFCDILIGKINPLEMIKNASDALDRFNEKTIISQVRQLISTCLTES